MALDLFFHIIHLKFLNFEFFRKSSQRKELKSIKSRDSLHWARGNTVKMNSEKGFNNNKNIIKFKIKEEDILKDLKLSSNSMRILEDVDQMTFDIFALRKETQRNEMIA